MVDLDGVGGARNDSASRDDRQEARAILTLPPYNADSTGREDSTQAFKKAIAAVSGMGGGLIYVPAGVYKVMKVHRYTLVDGHMFNFKDTTAIKLGIID